MYCWCAENSCPICSLSRRVNSGEGTNSGYPPGAMPTCLVTGGAGFLGSHLCEELLRRGHTVICVDNFETGSLANIEHIRVPEFRHVHHDIIQPLFVDEPIDVV